jgi:hypothetical protein
MRSGPALERILHILIELTNENLCHRRNDSTLSSYVVESGCRQSSCGPLGEQLSQPLINPDGHRSCSGAHEEQGDGTVQPGDVLAQGPLDTLFEVGSPRGDDLVDHEGLARSKPG